jgi:hypothetical protein
MVEQHRYRDNNNLNGQCFPGTQQTLLTQRSDYAILNLCVDERHLMGPIQTPDRLAPRGIFAVQEPFGRLDRNQIQCDACMRQRSITWRRIKSDKPPAAGERPRTAAFSILVTRAGLEPATK